MIKLIRPLILFSLMMLPCSAFAAHIVAVANGNPITDLDITARVKLMSLQGQSATDIRFRALNNIVNDTLKIEHAKSFSLVPSEKDVKAEIKNTEKQMQKPAGFFDANIKTAAEKDQLMFALRASMSWQNVLMKTVMPTIVVNDSEIDEELAKLSDKHGLPIDTTFLRLSGVTDENVSKLDKASCKTMKSSARENGISAQEITAPEYDLDENIRRQIFPLKAGEMSKIKSKSSIYICEKKNQKEYPKLRDYIQNQLMYRNAMFIGDQQLKSLRRKAVITIQDEQYRKALD